MVTKCIHLNLLLLIGFLLYACDDNDQMSLSSQQTHSAAFKIGEYRSSIDELGSKSYWIEGPDGLVLIDTQYLDSDTQALVDIAQNVTGKKVRLAIVLHAVPARFNGVSKLRKMGINVVSAETVVNDIAESVAVSDSSILHFSETLKQKYQHDVLQWDKATSLPNVMWKQTQEFDAAGLHFKAYVIRDAVSNAHLLIQIGEHLFVGDLLSPKYHANLLKGKSRQWLERLDEIEKFVGQGIAHPGKGYAMKTRTLVAMQREYLHSFRNLMAEFYTGGELSEGDQQLITARMQKNFPDYKSTYLIPGAIAAEWQTFREYDHQMLK